MDYLKARLKHAVCFRHKRGFGVHSPFMFDLIMNVIRDRKPRGACPVEMRQAHLLGRREYKVFRLLSRLVRCLRLREVVCLGRHSSLLAGYLSVLHGEVHITDAPSFFDRADFIYLGCGASVEEVGRMLPFAPEDYPRYLVIADIHKDARHAALWRRLREQATVSVDMMWYGLLLFDRKIQKGNYKLML